MKMKFSKEATIGVVSIISLVLLYIGVNYLKGINLFRPANHYYVACSNVKTYPYRDLFLLKALKSDSYEVSLMTIQQPEKFLSRSVWKKACASTKAVISLWKKRF